MSIKRFIAALFISFAIIFAAQSLTPITPESYAKKDACDITGVNDPLICGTKNTNEEAALQGRVKDTLNQVYLWIGIIAVVVIVIGGIKYMTSAGNPEAIKSAKNTLLYSIIGLVVTLSAFAITNLTIDALDGKKPSESSEETPATPPGEETVAVKSVDISGLSTIKKGDEYGFTVKIIPDYATNRTITWSSSNTNVATVSSDGRVKAIKPGETNITAKAHNGKSATKRVVVPKPVVAESVTITNKPNSIITGKSTTLSAQILPKNTENKTLKWSTSDKKILTVDDKGKIKGVKAGTATITVKTSNGKKDSAKIEVKDSADVVQSAKVKKLQEYVKKFAWPTYRGRDTAYAEAQKPEYTAAIRTSAHAGGCNGNDCGGYVHTLIRASGWDPSYSSGNTTGQYNYMRDSSKWDDITNKIHSNSDAKPGDVIIFKVGMISGHRMGHVLIYNGKIDGFGNVMSSASYCHRAPMADAETNIYRYVQQGYHVFRMKTGT